MSLRTKLLKSVSEKNKYYYAEKLRNFLSFEVFVWELDLPERGGIQRTL